MAGFAPRIPDRLLDAIPRLDDGGRPIAEVIRRVGDEADRLGITRPSYERIRQLIHKSRSIHPGPSDLRIALETAALLRSRDSAARAMAKPREERRW
jgi:hypothetical protein